MITLDTLKQHLLAGVVLGVALVLSSILVIEYLVLRGERIAKFLQSPAFAQIRDTGISFIDRSGLEEEGLIITPVSAGFVDTGLELLEGTELVLKASGFAHFKADEILLAAQNNQPLDFPWTSPDGYRYVIRPNDPEKSRDEYRKQFLMTSGGDPEHDRIGLLVGILLPTDKKVPSRQDVMEYGVAVGTGCSLPVNKKVRLFLAANDLWIDADAGDPDVATKARIGTDSLDSISTADLEKWRTLKPELRSLIFYSDNIGSYTVTFRTSKHGARSSGDRACERLAAR